LIESIQVQISGNSLNVGYGHVISSTRSREILLTMNTLSKKSVWRRSGQDATGADAGGDNPLRHCH